MRSVYSLFLMFLISSGVFGQDSSLVFDQRCSKCDSISYSTFPASLELMYAQKIFQNEVLNGAVNNFSNYTFARPLTYIGLGGTFVYLINRKKYHPGTIGFSHVLPQQVVLNDTLSGRISGFNIRFAIFGYDFFKNTRWLDLIFFPGFRTGRVRLYGHSRLEQVNAYFAPCITIAPRFNFGKISLQFRAEYELDITRSSWRNVLFSTSPKVDLGPLKSTGLTTSVSLGWILD